MSAVRVCDGCGAEIVYRGRGRPRRWCEACAEKKRAYREANRGEIAEKKRAYREANRGEIAEKQRAYREANRGEIAEKKRAYREANRGEIAEKQRARDGLLCRECGEHLRRPTPNGLCGFCAEEQAA